MKVCARNSIIRKLTNTSWGAQPETLRISVMGLCLSAAEYAAPAWINSAHAKQVDISINQGVRIMTGCLKPTPLEKLYPLSGIAPPRIRRQVSAEIERKKQTQDSRHPLYNKSAHASRLKSRKSFLKTTTPCPTTPETRRIELWKQDLPNPIVELEEKIASGGNLKYPI
ncbi:hypothetical protein M8J77_007133 [Diaphorina citri]|nr:hypothetical protein M8J77_007133 [Diaphorina citri]